MDRFDEVIATFEKLRNEENARKMTAYMRQKFKFFGLPAPERKAACKRLLSEARKSNYIDWALLDRCWENDYREMQYFVIDYLAAVQRHLTFDDIVYLEHYVRTRQWWDTIDGLDTIIGKIGLTDPRLKVLMLQWSKDEDFWVRRIAIDHQLGFKERTDTVLLEQIIVNNLGSTEFFINKAIGWSLREYSKTDPVWVRDFIARHAHRLSPLSIREASKYL